MMLTPAFILLLLLSAEIMTTPAHAIGIAVKTKRMYPHAGSDGGRGQDVNEDGDLHGMIRTPLLQADEEQGRGFLGDTECCSICLESLQGEPGDLMGVPPPADGYEPWLRTPCGHSFHRHCLARWQQRNRSCPSCRRPVVPAVDDRGGERQHLHGRSADGHYLPPPEVRRTTAEIWRPRLEQLQGCCTCLVEGCSTCVKATLCVATYTFIVICVLHNYSCSHFGSSYAGEC
jgi:hypothetical protein